MRWQLLGRGSRLHSRGVWRWNLCCQRSHRLSEDLGALSRRAQNPVVTVEEVGPLFFLLCFQRIKGLEGQDDRFGFEHGWQRRPLQYTESVNHHQGRMIRLEPLQLRRRKVGWPHEGDYGARAWRLLDQFRVILGRQSGSQHESGQPTWHELDRANLDTMLLQRLDELVHLGNKSRSEER